MKENTCKSPTFTGFGLGMPKSYRMFNEVIDQKFKTFYVFNC